MDQKGQFLFTIWFGNALNTSIALPDNYHPLPKQPCFKTALKELKMYLDDLKTVLMLSSCILMLFYKKI